MRMVNMAIAKAHGSSRRRCHTALVGASDAARENPRRALRALGRTPFVFESIAELSALGSRLDQFELLVVVCPLSLVASHRATLRKVRRIMGDDVPVLLLLERSPFVLLGDRKIDVASGPFTFRCLYHLLQEYAACRGMRVDPAPPHWGPYRFHIDALAVSIGSLLVTLEPVAFDLALELFYGRGRLVPVDRLRGILAAHGLPDGKRALHARISRVRRALGLDADPEWRVDSLPGVGYRLARPEAHASTATRLGSTNQNVQPPSSPL